MAPLARKVATSKSCPFPVTPSTGLRKPSDRMAFVAVGPSITGLQRGQNNRKRQKAKHVRMEETIKSLATYMTKSIRMPTYLRPTAEAKLPSTLATATAPSSASS